MIFRSVNLFAKNCKRRDQRRDKERSKYRHRLKRPYPIRQDNMQMSTTDEPACRILLMAGWYVSRLWFGAGLGLSTESALVAAGFPCTTVPKNKFYPQRTWWWDGKGPVRLWWTTIGHYTAASPTSSWPNDVILIMDLIRYLMWPEIQHYEFASHPPLQDPASCAHS